MESKLSIRYQGGAAEFGIDALEASLALEGFANFTIKLSRSLCGEDARPQIILTTLSRGSSLFEFVLNVAPVAAGISQDFGLLPDLFKDGIELLRHLRGAPPQSVKKAHKGSVYVENNEGNIIVFNQNITNLVLEKDIGRDSAKFLGQPLQDSAKSVELSVDDHVVAKVETREADCFRSVTTGETLLETTSEIYLAIKTVQLEGDGRWKFTDGRNTITAPIEDQKFLERVKKGGERFGRGDTLRVRLRSVQERVAGKLVAKHIIEKVLSHDLAETQGKLI